MLETGVEWLNRAHSSKGKESDPNNTSAHSLADALVDSRLTVGQQSANTSAIIFLYMIFYINSPMRCLDQILYLTPSYNHFSNFRGSFLKELWLSR